MGMDVAEKVLQQFSRQQFLWGFVEGVLSGLHRSQRYAFFLKHRDDCSRACLEAIHAKVVGKWPFEALQKGIEIRDELLVFFE